MGNLQISSSALVDPLEELSRLSLQTLKQLKLLPAMVLKSRELITLTMLLLKSLRKQRPSLNLMSGLLVFFSMFSCPDNFPSKEKPLKKPRTTSFKFEWLYKECTMEGTRLLMWIFKRQPIRRPTLEEVGVHRWMNPADYMLKKRQRARFPTNRIQKFARDYHKSRPLMDMDSQSFMARLLQ